MLIRQCATQELIALLFVFECKAHFPGPAEKMSNLVDDFKKVVIYDGFHPSVITEESAWLSIIPYLKRLRHKLGSMVVYIGAGVFLMALIPKPIWGRVMFVCCALVIATTGVLLRKHARSA